MSHIVIFMIFHIVICMYYYRLASGLLRVGGTKQSSAEWLWRLAHGCWSPLPTYRILCDARSDDLLGRICHPFCSVSVTPSKARLSGFGYQ